MMLLKKLLLDILWQSHNFYHLSYSALGTAKLSVRFCPLQL